VAFWYAGLLPGFVHTLYMLPPPSRRRYGGYLVHFGIVLAFIGFTGRAWTVDKETSLTPGQSFDVGDYHLIYTGPRMEVDVSKRMIFADVRVTKDGRQLGSLHPGKFIYKKSPDAPTTEVAILHSVREDLYVIVGTVNPESKVATLQIHVNPLVSWIWIGCVVLVLGSIVAMWPQFVPEESRAWAYGRSFAAVATSVSIGLLLALLPAPAYAQAGMDNMHSHTVRIDNDTERGVFGSLQCLCGCRESLATCACGEADDIREELRHQIAAGETKEQIVLAYQAAHGTSALAVPPNAGAMRAIYAVPLVAFFGGAVGLGLTVRRWRDRGNRHAVKAVAVPGVPAAHDEYDARLDDELKDIDG
jgi:cytochrome c-type biogenesis protein CcmF